MIFGKKSKFPIGLDISDLSLKLIQLKQKRGKIKIQALGRQILPKGVIENGEIINEEEVIKAINKMISKPKYGTVSSDEVIACLPETKTFIKTIRIEDNPNKISDIVEHEIEKHVPFSIDEMYYDWQTIKKSENYSLVLVGAAPKKIVDQYTQLLNNAKLSIRALEIEPVSICRSLLPEESMKFDRKISKNYAILDIGAKRTSIIIYAHNTIITSISLPISGEETTEKISKTLEISHDQAEKAKVICGLDKQKAQGVICEILSEKIDNLITRLKETINFFYANYGDLGPIDEITLCGGGSNIKNLEQVIFESTKIKTIHGDIFINLAEIEEKFSGILEEKHYIKDKNKTAVYTQTSIFAYATTIGLALRGIFLKDE